MAKRYLGHKPRSSDWKHLGPVEEGGTRWLVYVRPDPSSPWCSVKVVADGRVTGKANYWLGWNGERYSHQTDLPRLLSRDELLKGVTRLLCDFSAGQDLL